MLPVSSNSSGELTHFGWSDHRIDQSTPDSDHGLSRETQGESSILDQTVHVLPVLVDISNVLVDVS